ncbi:MBL fold metallo-hydrolase [Parabacteroides sp. OttesenSCG-928-G06]|nr:MBL fold metallo-hydrolase [Parabacteroides sp. OttesenSCG-928-K15]MDL2281682.1 MBL fold metallo-hydrolase [Parabacteroides sp. OttesenSCG-928-G06]
MAQETPSVYTYIIGDFMVSLLSESQQTRDTGILIGATDEMIAECTPDGTFSNAVNAFLVQTPTHNILFDTGLGQNLFMNMESLGVTAEDVDILCITHMHGDHIGGMLQYDKVMFPNATVYLPQPEYDYWMNTESRQAHQVIEAYKERIKLFTPQALGSATETLLPGIQAIAAYGHTPGHTTFLLDSEGEQLLIWGDLTHAMAVQMPYPQVAVTYDVNAADAISARQAILQYVTEYKIPIAGMHITYPAMGKIEKRSGEGYRFIPFK